MCPWSKRPQKCASGLQSTMIKSTPGGLGRESCHSSGRQGNPSAIRAAILRSPCPRTSSVIPGRNSTLKRSSSEACVGQTGRHTLAADPTSANLWAPKPMLRSVVKTLDQAKEKAEELISSRDKVARLLSQCIHKAKQNYEFLLAPWESLHILLRMVRAWLCGAFSPPVLTGVGGVVP